MTYNETPSVLKVVQEGLQHSLHWRRGSFCGLVVLVLLSSLLPILLVALGCLGSPLRLVLLGQLVGFVLPLLLVVLVLLDAALFSGNNLHFLLLQVHLRGPANVVLVLVAIHFASMFLL